MARRLGYSGAGQIFVKKYFDLRNGIYLNEMCLRARCLSLLVFFLSSLLCSAYQLKYPTPIWKPFKASTLSGMNRPLQRTVLPRVAFQTMKPTPIPRSSRVPLALSINGASDIATGIGYVIGAGSVLLYTPMIYRVIRRRSADGLSATTWLMKFMCYSFNGAYNMYHEYPLSS